LDNKLFCVQPEKALMQAATPATENARRRPEAESTLEANHKQLKQSYCRLQTALAIELHTDSICLEKEEQITSLSSSRKQEPEAKAPEAVATTDTEIWLLQHFFANV
nr:hypothetical protein [Tanacetum cinerariifolium]